MVVLCVSVCCVCVFAVTVSLWPEWMSDLGQEKEHPSRISLLQWFLCRCLCAACTDLSLSAVHSRRSCLNSPLPPQFMKNTDVPDENAQCCLKTHQDQSFPPVRARPRRSNITCFCKTQLKPPTVQRPTSPSEEPNVCLLSLVFTSSLPPLSQPSPPVFAEPTRTDLHAAVQRQPQPLQPYQLPRLLPWSVLPAADRTDQRDGKPRGQRPLAVCCQGPGVLHSGSKGKDVVSLKTFVFRHVKKVFFLW